MRELLILDCDGVLYPASNINHQDFIRALQKTQEHFGYNFCELNTDINNGSVFWNTIYKNCANRAINFDDFCREMIKNINYGKIRKSNVLLEQLKKATENYDVVVLSDNHKYHLEH